MTDISPDEKQKRLFSFERVEPMFGGGGRDWSVDVLRCISCFMVCALHSFIFTQRYELTTGLGPSEWTPYLVYRMIFGSPTVLFVMVSGIFFLSPERNVRITRILRKNVLKMAFAYIFWSLIYALYRISLMDPQPEMTWDFFFREWLFEPYHMWYIPMIIGLYMLSPLLRPITATKDTNLFRYFVIIFIGALIVSTLFSWPRGLEVDELTNSMIIMKKTPYLLICQYPAWMLFGWIAYTYRPTRALRYIIYLLGIAATIAGIWFNIYNWLQVEDLNVTSTTQKFSVLIFLKNTALFYFIVTVFRNHRFSKIGKAILRRFSADTLIIYLIHMLFIYIMYDNGFLYDKGYTTWTAPWIYALIAYFGGGVVAEIFHVFWDPIKKNLFSGEKRSERIYKKIEKEKSKM